MDKIKKAMEQARTSIEVDGVIISPEQEALVRAKLLKEITEEEFNQQLMKLIKGKKNG
ncbi:hypothetical protein IHV09_08745 [Fictibacillus sp. 23RED33]|uniref:hypothetical protein n=1 Tax=Fictibacillus sp. 23RED33 TaxID=2745879 RepID=UPI0018CDE100|nr:hypothetical protein [Fictibacillus sp. 23RED33]MBH0173643.1 hypothetical protein [Fictibacillus sp. 23RED33]